MWSVHLSAIQMLLTIQHSTYVLDWILLISSPMQTMHPNLLFAIHISSIVHLVILHPLIHMVPCSLDSAPYILGT